MSVATKLPESSAIAGPNGLATTEIVVPDDMLYEVVDGQIVEKIVGTRQVGVAFRLAYRLEAYAEPKRVGQATTEMIFLLDRARNLQRRPDAAFISNARWPADQDFPTETPWDMVPDLAIEVVSPTNTADAVNDKRLEYFTAGVRQVWVVYTKSREIHVYSSAKQVRIFQLGDELDGGDLLPGFRLPLTEIFKKDPPKAKRARKRRS
jgi:Uma2 family endonuclease